MQSNIEFKVFNSFSATLPLRDSALKTDFRHATRVGGYF